MRNPWTRHWMSLCSALLGVTATGCAVGNTHTFNYQPLARNNIGQGIVVVLLSVDDQRPDIVSGDEPPSWVGEQRGGFGNPFNVKTTSGKPFADEVAETLRRDLASVGFEALLVPNADREVVPKVLRDRGAERAISVVMRKFNSDTYVNVDVEWDFEATVLDAHGKELASNHEQGMTTLEGSLLNAPKAAKKAVPPFFYDLIHRLVAGNEAMIEALTSG